MYKGDIRWVVRQRFSHSALRWVHHGELISLLHFARVRVAQVYLYLAYIFGFISRISCSASYSIRTGVLVE